MSDSSPEEEEEEGESPDRVTSLLKNVPVLTRRRVQLTTIPDPDTRHRSLKTFILIREATRGEREGRKKQQNNLRHEEGKS